MQMITSDTGIKLQIVKRENKGTQDSCFVKYLFHTVIGYFRLEGTSEGHLVQTPGQNRVNQFRLDCSGLVSNRVLIIFKNGDARASLGNLFQGLIVLF